VLDWKLCKTDHNPSATTLTERELFLYIENSMNNFMSQRPLKYQQIRHFDLGI